MREQFGTNRYGIDVARMRSDALDRQATEFVERLARSGVRARLVDLGCGSGTGSARLARAGADVTAVDMGPDLPRRRSMVRYPGGSIRFMNTRIEHWLAAQCVRSRYDAIYSQRVFHYFRHDVALRLLQQISNLLHPQGRLFLSVSGVATELGSGYGHKGRRVEHRYVHLTLAMRRKHQITAPVCLYSPDELRALLQRAGYLVESIFVSDFGNIKCVARRKGMP